MAGLPFDAKTFKELWNTWTIRGLIILSLLLQSFLILFAPLRRPIGDKWFFRIPLWIAYLLADWIAIFVIGLILHAERSHDILVFWAPFLLLHLGVPDTITSFSLEDNEFWIRHLLELILQVGSTVYAIIESLPHNKLLLPTLLVLTAGIIKYAERNCAFYLACSDHYGEARFSFFKKFDNGVNSNNALPLLKELTPYGTLRNLLLGPLITPQRRDFVRSIFLKEESAELRQLQGPKVVRKMIEFELSLLYEILHTKFPVIKCKIGYILRIICMGCISGALLSFILITKAKQYRGELENSEVWITYGLLIGAITLDFISIGLLISSDYYITDDEILQAFENNVATMTFLRGLIDARVNNRNLWSKRIPQLNLLTYFVKACPDWLNKLHKFLPIRFVLEFIQGFRSMSSQDFKDEVWHYIFTQVKEMANRADTVEKGKEICLERGDGILHRLKDRILSQRLKDLDDVKTLLTWHIATELCFLQCKFDLPTSSSENPSTSSSENPDYRGISKLLSDYVFYLLHEETVIGSKIDRRMVFNDTYKHIQSVCPDKDIQSVYRRISTVSECELSGGPQRSVLRLARELFNELEGPNKSIPWELISKVWVELTCYVAINCRPNLHAQQPSKGGQLLTIVWLLMNHFGLGTQFETDRHASC